MNISKKVLSVSLAFVLATSAFFVLSPSAVRAQYEVRNPDKSISSPNEIGSILPNVSPPAVQTCAPGDQDNFDSQSSRWYILIGDNNTIGTRSGYMYQRLSSANNLLSLASYDSFSGDFQAEIEITNFAGYNPATDYVSTFFQAVVDGDNYFLANATLSDAEGLTITGSSNNAGVEKNGNTVTIDPNGMSDSLIIRLVRTGSDLKVFYVYDDMAIQSDTITGVITSDVYLTMNSSLVTTSTDGHVVEPRITSYRQGCNIPYVTDWQMNGGLTSTPVSSVVFDGRMYQFIGGWSYPNRIYMRSTQDRVFDGINTENGNAADPMESWVHEPMDGGPGGETATEVGVAVFDNGDGERLYISVKGRDSGKVFTKSMGTDGEWDTEWNENGGKTGTAIGMTSFTPSGESERLYQVIRGFSTDYVYYRYTIDGNFDGSDASEDWNYVWNNGNVARTPNTPAVEVFNGSMFISVRGASGSINYAYSGDGIWDGNVAIENFVKSGGATTTTPALEVHNGKLFQITKGNSTDLIYTRYFDTTFGWSQWFEHGGQMPSRGDMTSFKGAIVQTVRGNSGNIFVRVLNTL